MRLQKKSFLQSQRSEISGHLSVGSEAYKKMLGLEFVAHDFLQLAS